MKQKVMPWYCHGSLLALARMAGAVAAVAAGLGWGRGEVGLERPVLSGSGDSVRVQRSRDPLSPGPASRHYQEAKATGGQTVGLVMVRGRSGLLIC